MVTPFSSSAICIVSLLWLIKINCKSSANSWIKPVKRATLASSSGASTSSSTQNGAGCCLNIAKIKLSAVRVFSPPERTARRLLRLPFGCAINVSPARHCSDLCLSAGILAGISSVFKVRLACPPPKTLANKLANSWLTASNVCINSVLVVSSMDAIAWVKVSILAAISVVCCASGSRRSLTSANSATAARLTAPILSNCCSSVARSFSSSAILSGRTRRSCAIKSANRFDTLIVCFGKSDGALYLSLTR